MRVESSKREKMSKVNRRRSRAESVRGDVKKRVLDEIRIE